VKSEASRYKFLGQLCTRITDGTHQTPVYQDEGVVFISAKNIKGGQLDFSDRKYIAKQEHDLLTKRNKPSPGDLLLTKSGSLGDVAIIPELDFEFSIFESLALLKPRRDLVDPHYLHQYLRSPEAAKYFHAITTGLAVKHLHLGDLRKLKVFLPTVRRQREISQQLSVWDKAIQKTEQLITAKAQLYNALSGQLLFGLTRFKQYGASKPKSLHWFSISSEWPVVAIREIAREVSAVADANDGLPVLSCTKYDGLVDSLQYFKKQVFSHDLSKYKLVRRGQFAYATNHIEEGSIGYLDVVPAGLVSPIYTVFETDTNRIDDGYLYKILKTERLRQLFAASTNASVDRRGSLRWSEFARIHIPLPPLEEQREINHALNTSKRETELLQAEVSALKTQKRGLMQKLLTGQWRLPLPEQEAV